MTLLRRITGALRSAFSGKAGLLRASALVVVALAFVLAPSAVDACPSPVTSCVALIFVKIFQLLTALMGWILILIVEALIRVAQAFNFVSPGPKAVQLGWVVTRDLSNMFFIVIMLIVAFGTILGSSTYHYSKNLPRLLIMAVVINFSKTICGIFIDIGQVIMMTFVNAFKETAAGNFMQAYQINKLLALGNSSNGTYEFDMVIAMMFAFILVTIAVSVTLVLLVVVLFRVVMLWILVILSPLAFLTSAIPRGGDYYGKWWGEFKKYIITGPVIAFFMWLALASVQQTGPGGFASESFPPSYAGSGEAAAQASAATQGRGIPTEAGTANTIMNMVIAISIMFAGLKYASDSGVAGAGFAKQMRGGLEKTGRAILRGGVGAVTSPVTGAAKSVGGRTMSSVGSLLARTPVVGRTPLGALGRRMAIKGEQLEETQRKKREATYASSAKDLARFSPNALGSKQRLIGATDAQKMETMEAALGRPDALAAMKKSGAAKMLLGDAEALAKKDPSRKGAIENFKKAVWNQIEDPEEQKTILGKMSGEEARKYMKPEDMDVTNLGRLSKGAITDVLNNGKPEMQSAAMASLGELQRLGELDRVMKEKRMTYGDIPAEAYDAAGDKADLLRSGALAAAERDPNLMRKMADDPLMRDAMSGMAAANLASATEGPDRAKKRAMAMMLGSDGGPSNDEEAREFATLSLKDLQDLDKNAPVDSKEIQEAIDKGITAALKHGTAAMSQAILSSPTMSQRVPLTEAREVEASTPKYTERLDRTAGVKMAGLDRQKKESGADQAAIDAEIKGIRDAVGAVKAAAKDLSATEEAIAKQREDYGAAQRGGNTAAMKTIAASIKQALKEVESKKAAVAAANTALKSKT